MAFAAFAVVAPAETDDAVADLTVDIDGTKVIKYTSGALTAGKYYYFGEDATDVVLPAEGSTVPPVVALILNGATVTFKASATTATGNVDVFTFAVDSATSTTITLTGDSATKFSGETFWDSGVKDLAYTAWDAASKKSQFDVGVNAADASTTFGLAAVGGAIALASGNDMDLYAASYTISGSFGTVTNYAATTALTLTNFTATLKADSASTNVLKLTKFSGKISINTGVATIEEWDSGDVEVMTAATGKDVVLRSNIPTGSSLYVNAGQFIKTADSDIYDGTATPASKFTNNGTISIKQTKTSAGVTAVGTFTLAITMENNGVISNLGVFSYDNNAITNTSTGKITTGESAATATTIAVTWNGEGDVTNNGTFTFKETTKESGVKFTSDSTGDVRNQVASNKDVSGALTSDTYGWSQSATIIASSTLTGKLTLDGLLIINEGVTLTISSDGEIELASPQSVIINNGNIVIQNNKGIDNLKGFVYNYGKMTLNDPSIELTYEAPTLNVGAFMKNYGTITNSVGYVVIGATGSFMNQSGATFITNSYLYLANGALVSNAGKIQIDGIVKAITADKEIALTDKNATVQIIGLVLPDKGLIITNETGVEDAVGSIVLASTYTADPAHTDLITGLNIATYDSGKALIVSGNVSLYSDTYGQTVSDSYTITLNGDTAYIGDLTLQEKVLLGGEDKTFKVVGTLVAVNPGSAEIKNMGTAGVITVDGKIITNISPLSGYKKLNAAMYQTISESFVKTYYYTTLPKAVAEASELGLAEVTTYGDLEVKSDLTIPAPLIVKNQGKITIKDGADVIVADGAELNNGGAIYVNGSLYAYDIEDITGLTTAAAIVSDVKVVGVSDVLYTNLYDALDAASAGDVVVITKEGEVKLTKDTTIPLGVTLDTNEKALNTDGKKLINNGTLVLYAAGSFSDYEDITLNGYIVSDDQRTYNTTRLTGAYFSTEVNNVDRYYIAGIKNLGDITAAGVTDIAVYGDISTPSITFAGADEAATVTFYDDVDVTTITASKAKIVFSAGTVVKATVTDGANSVALNGDVPSSKTLTVTLGDKFKVGGDFDAVTTAASKFTFTLSGTSTVDALNVYSLKVGGSAITAGNVAITKDLVVTGDFTVADKKTLTAKNAMVTGSLDVDGSATITNVTVGSTSNAVKAAADVGGKVTATVIVLYAGNNVDDEIIEGMKYTEFFVDGKLWFTVYSNGEVELNNLVVPVTNAIAVADEYDGLTVGENGKLSGKLTPGEKASYNLAVDYEIYNITIITDAGIKAVYIDGKVMASPASGTNNFELEGLKAGTYKVTYTLINGYEGSAQLYTADGTILKDNSFVLSGTSAADQNIILQLLGTEKETPAEPTPVEQNEWTITTILLVILVILIAIMAVIVALRLNRS